MDDCKNAASRQHRVQSGLGGTLHNGQTLTGTALNSSEFFCTKLERRPDKLPPFPTQVPLWELDITPQARRVSTARIDPIQMLTGIV
jgi:hypothetical protein